MSFLSTRFQPSHEDGVLRVIILGRKSQPNPTNQNQAIDASIADAEGFLRRNYDGPVQVTRLGEQVSGMVADRITLRTTEDMIAAGEVDIILTEDLGRLFRNPRHMWAFIQDCVDCDIRVICIHDNLDTASEDWETTLTVAAVRHGLVVSDTKRRIRRSGKYSFEKGGAVGKVRFGYRKLTRDQAESGEFGPRGLRIARLDEWTATIREMARWVISTTPVYSWREMADMANNKGIPVGPYSRDQKWTENTFRDFLTDRILGGFRSFRRVLSRQVLKTGKSERKRNPNGPQYCFHAELAHLSPENFAELEAAIARRFIPRADRGKKHPRYRVPRSRTLFPSQHATCICGRKLQIYVGHALKCGNTRRGAAFRCWNHLQVDMSQARNKILNWVVQQLDQVPSFRQEVVDLCWQEMESRRKGKDGDDSLVRLVVDLERQADNYAKAIARAIHLDSVLEQAQQVQTKLEGAKRKLAARQEALKSVGADAFLDKEDMARSLGTAMIAIAKYSYDFADLMKRLLPKIEIVPVQAVSSGLIRARARVTLEMTVANGDKSDVFHAEAELDLFEPPAYVANLERCVEARKESPDASIGDLAQTLGLGHMQVRRALRLAKLLEERGLTSVYLEIRERPENASRWRHSA